MNVHPLFGQQFAVCVTNSGYAAALEVRKIYQVLPDADAENHEYLRVIDESGEDYLYPKDYFILLDLPPLLQDALFRAA